MPDWFMTSPRRSSLLVTASGWDTSRRRGRPGWLSRPPAGVAHLHQDPPQHVSAAAVAAVAPVGVALRVLNQHCIAGAEQDRFQLVVLAELGEHRFTHDRVLD